MADNQEILEFRVDASDAVKGAEQINKGVKDIETQSGKAQVGLEGVGAAAEKAQLKVVSFIDTTQRAMARTVRTAQLRAEFAGMEQDMKRLTTQAIEYQRVKGDTKAEQAVLAAHNAENAAIAKIRAEEKALAAERVAAAAQQKRLDAEAAAATQRQMVLETARRRAIEAPLTPLQREQRRELQAVQGDSAKVLEVAAAHKVVNEQIDAQNKLEAVNLANKKARLEADKVLAQNAAEYAAEQKAAVAAAEEVAAATAKIQTRAQYAGLSPEQRRALDQQREIQAVAGDPAAVAERMAAHKLENEQLAARNKLDEVALANQKARVAGDKSLADNAAKYAAEKAADERALANFTRSSQTSAEKLVAEYKKLSAAFADDPAKLAEVEKGFKKLGQEILNASQKGEGFFSRNTAMGRTMLGLKDFFEGRRAYGEVEIGTAIQKAIAGRGAGAAGAEDAGLAELKTLLSGAGAGAAGAGAAGAVEGGAGGVLGTISGILATPAGIAGTVAVGIGAIGIASLKAATSLGEYAQKLHEATVQTGISAEQLQRLDIVAKATGGDYTVFTGTIRGMTQALGGTDLAAEKARNDLVKMGVNVLGLQTGTADFTEELIKLAQGLDKNNAQFTKTHEAIEIFKRKGIDLLPVLENLREHMDLARTATAGLTNEQVESARKFEASWNIAKARLDVFLTTYFKEPLSLVVRIAMDKFVGDEEDFKNNLKELGDWLEKYASWFVHPTGRLAEAIMGTRKEAAKAEPPKPAFAPQADIDAANKQVEAFQSRVQSTMDLQERLRESQQKMAEERSQITAIGPGQKETPEALKALNDHIAAYNKAASAAEGYKQAIKNNAEAETLQQEADKKLAETRAVRNQQFVDAAQGLGDAENYLTSALYKEQLEYDKAIAKYELAKSKGENLTKAIKEVTEAHKIMVEVLSRDWYVKYVESAQKAAEELDRTMQQEQQKLLEHQQRFNDENQRLHIENIQKQNEADARAVEERAQAELKALDRADAQTIQQKIALEQKRVEIENRATQEALAFKLKANQAAADEARAKLDEQVRNIQEAGGVADPYAVLMRQREISIAQQRQDQADMIKAQEEMLQRMADAANKMAEIIIEADKKVFETFKSEAESVLDTLFKGGKGFGQALGNALKDAVEKPLKDIMSSQIAASLTHLITGDTVTMERQYWGSGAIGRFLTRAGVGAVPTFHVAKIDRPGYLGDLRLLTKGGVLSAPVAVTNPEDMKPQITVQSPPSNVSVNTSNSGGQNYFNLLSRGGGGGPPAGAAAEYGAGPQITGGAPPVPTGGGGGGGDGGGAAALPAGFNLPLYPGVGGPTTGFLGPYGKLLSSFLQPPPAGQTPTISPMGNLIQQLTGAARQQQPGQPPAMSPLQAIKSMISGSTKVTLTSASGDTRTISVDRPSMYHFGENPADVVKDEFGFRLRPDQIAAQLSSPYMPGGPPVTPDLTMPNNVFGGAGYGTADYSGLGPLPIPQLGYDPGMTGAGGIGNVFGLDSIAQTGAPYISPSDLPVAAGPWGGTGSILTGGGGVHGLMGMLGGGGINASAIASFAAPYAIMGGISAMMAGRAITSNPQAGIGRGIGAGLLGAAGGLVAAGGLAALAPSIFVPLLAAGPIGWIAAAAIGATIALSGFINSRPRQIRDQVKAVYGVDIRDNGVLAELSKLVDQNGGNIRMTILGSQARSIIAMYALSTGQNARGIVAQPVMSQYATSGGQTSAIPGYFAGQQVYPGQLQATVGTSYMNPGIYNPSTSSFLTSQIPTGANVVPGGMTAQPAAINLSLDGPSTNALLTGGAVQAIQSNPRLVSVATISGQDASAGRRDASANVLQPNFIVS